MNVLGLIESDVLPLILKKDLATDLPFYSLGKRYYNKLLKLEQPIQLDIQIDSNRKDCAPLLLFLAATEAATDSIEIDIKEGEPCLNVNNQAIEVQSHDDIQQFIIKHFSA